MHLKSLVAVRSVAAAVVLLLSFAGHGQAQGNTPPGNPAQGNDLFRTCAACHQIGAGAKNDVGPILNNIVGRRVGSRTGFRYSKAMASAGADGMIWTEEALGTFLEDPRTAMRGNRMAYAGLRDAGQRADLVAYLKTLKFDDPAESKNLK